MYFPPEIYRISGSKSGSRFLTGESFSEKLSLTSISPREICMAKNLVIVESPTKAKMLARFLGSDYVVESSFGHIRDLPNKKAELPPAQQKLPYATLAIDVDNDFAPLYVVPPKAKKHVAKLKKLMDDQTTVWLASDEDREGEAIAWHLLEVLKPKKTNAIKRIVFHEITKEAILQAVKQPRTVDQSLVHAQQARRILDRLVGYLLSPLIWKKIRYGLSAGRVQSVAVKLIVDREREIQAFTPEEYWSILADLEKDGKRFVAEFQKLDGKKFVPKNAAEAEAIHAAVKGQPFAVSAIEEKEAKRRPSPPFTTSTLQQEAARKLGFSVKKTMTVAQKLYEGVEMGGGHAGGLITYMRTDSMNLSEKALQDAKAVIENRFGNNFAERRVFTKKQKGAQEAHEAIRPTELSRTPEEVNAWPKARLDQDARRLYELIWKRTIASQMADAILLQTGVDFEVAGKNGSKKTHLFRATGQRVKFPGFIKVYFEGRDDEIDENAEAILPQLTEGESLKPLAVHQKQHFTKPPARYTEASLVKKMEAEGIGRPSTYAPTVATIMSRGYIEKDGKQLIPTDTAFVVTDLLAEHFQNIVDLHFTAKMEEKLDEIADNKADWVAFLKDFYRAFHATIEAGEKISRAEATHARELGKDPGTGQPVFAKHGKYGPMLQMGATEGEEKPLFAPLLKHQSVETITLEDALQNFRLPRTVGQAPTGEDIVAHIGRFGPFLKQGSTYVSIAEEDLFTISLEDAMSRLKEKQQLKQKNTILEFPDAKIRVLSGQYGPYITDGKKNAKIPKDTDPKKLTVDVCQKLLDSAPTRKWKRR